MENPKKIKSQQSICVSISQKFIPLYEEFLTLLERDKEYLEHVSMASEKNKKLLDSHTQKGFKIRYAIAFTLRELHARKAKEEGVEEEYEETEDRDI